jgi:hypothetical protein
MFSAHAHSNTATSLINHAHHQSTVVHCVIESSVASFFLFASAARLGADSRREGYPEKMIRKKRASIITYR